MNRNLQILIALRSEDARGVIESAAHHTSIVNVLLVSEEALRPDKELLLVNSLKQLRTVDDSELSNQSIAEPVAVARESSACVFR